MTPKFKVVAAESSLVITADLPDFRATDFTMAEEGRFLRVDCRRRTEYGPFTSRFRVPEGYDLTGARLQYIYGEMRIDVPKNQAV